MSQSPQRPIARPGPARPPAQRTPPRFHPAVPAQIVMKHIQGSKNRALRHAADADNVRKGLRALDDDSMRLRAALAQHPEEISRLEAGLMALKFRGDDLIAAHEQMIAMERDFQNECILWLNRKDPTVQVEAGPGPIEHISSTGHEIPTPASISAGDAPAGEATPEPAADQVAGYYTMADGTRVYVNARNEPVYYSAEVIRGGKKLRVFVNTKNQEIPKPEGLPGEITCAPATAEAFVSIAEKESVETLKTDEPLPDPQVQPTNGGG